MTRDNALLKEPAREGWETAPPELHYLTTERDVSARSGRSLHVPLRVFDLRGIGISHQEFFDCLLPSYAKLEWDTYDVRREQLRLLQSAMGEALSDRELFAEYYAGSAGRSRIEPLIARLDADVRHAFERILPARRRAAARFRMTRERQAAWTASRTPLGAFYQKVDDDRSSPRFFAEMEEAPVASDPFQGLLVQLARMVQEVRPSARALGVVAHQMSTVVRRGMIATSAPEGIHQDGADYIVSALVVERRGIRGGKSRVYARSPATLLLETTLAVGQGIFQSDKGTPLWHDVTPIEVEPGQEEGVRSLIGFDVEVDE